VDADLVTAYAKHLAGLGGVIQTNAKVTEVVKSKGGLQVQFSAGAEGGAVDADQVLRAVGRSPYTEGRGAAEAGVELERGRGVGRRAPAGPERGLREGHRRRRLGQAARRAHHRAARDRPHRRGDARDPERADAGAAGPHDSRAPDAARIADGSCACRARARYSLWESQGPYSPPGACGADLPAWRGGNRLSPPGACGADTA